MKTKIAIENYFNHLEAQNYSPCTMTLYKINMDHFLKVAPNKVVDISKETVKKFTEQLHKSSVSYKTKNSRLITLRNFLKFTGKEVELNYNWRDIELFSDRTDSGKIYVPKQEVVDLFLETIVRSKEGLSFGHRAGKLLDEVRSDALVNTLYSTGLRISELMSLNRRDVETDSDGPVKITIVGKGSKPRLVFINKGTVKIIKEYLKLREDDCEALFVSVKRPISRVKQRFAQKIVQDRVIVLQDEGKMPAGTIISPHTLRHAHATHLIASGINIAAVKDLMGHSSINTTQRYLHLSNADLEKEYNKVYS